MDSAEILNENLDESTLKFLEDIPVGTSTEIPRGTLGAMQRINPVRNFCKKLIKCTEEVLGETILKISGKTIVATLLTFG